MTVYRLPLERRTLHGCFDRTLPPVLIIESGDTVIFQTLDARWGPAQHERGEDAIARDPELDPGHALSGPIAVRGATRGDALVVEIGELRPGSRGFTWTGPRPQLPRYDMGVTREAVLEWEIDTGRRVAREQELGVEVDIRPFMGVMGNAPAAAGRHSTTPPRRVGGNIDCRELVAGSSLILPVEVDGALFSVGDGHAAQGDGEVEQTAIECPMEHVELTFRVQSGGVAAAPVAITPAGHVTMGFGETLDDAAAMALDGMLLHLEATFGLDRAQAMALASVAVNLHVTQVVNQTVGVHGILPPDALRFVR